MKKTKVLACVLAVALALGAGCLAAGCSSSAASSKDATSSSASASAETRTFTDSLGRQVEVPANITKVVPSGHTANQVLLTFAPDLMVGISQELTDEQAKYIGSQYQSLPVLGAIFGNKGDLNKEAVAATGAQLLIDWGEAKKGMAEDLDNLQQQLNIPCVHIEATLATYDEAYAMLGELLNMPERGKQLGDYCANAYQEVEQAMSTIPEDQRVRVAYLVGESGLAAIAKGSYQGTILDMCATNVVEVEKASGSGLGNEISLEQISLWNPDMIIFGPTSIYDSVAADETWAQISAIANNNYYQVPSDPYIWLNNPPTVNQIMGLQWFPRLCYPQAFSTDMKTAVTSYYKTFYNYQLTDAEYDQLTAKAVAK